MGAGGTDVSGHWYVIHGVNPVPWTAPSVSVGRKKGGGGFYPRVYSAAELKNYKEAIREEVQERYDPDVLDGDIALSFYFWRHIDLGTTGKKKISSKEADATNLQKSTEDALQGVLFKNDRQVKHAQSWIMAQTSDTEPMIVICVQQDFKMPQVDVESGIDLFSEEYQRVVQPDVQDHIDNPEELF